MDAEDFIKIVPIDFIIMSLVVGFLVIWLSPLNLFLPPLIKETFGLNLSASSTEILSSIVIIILISIAIGFPSHFLKDALIGNGGLNNWITAGLGKWARKKTELVLITAKNDYKIEVMDRVLYGKWLKDSGYGQLLARFHFENSLLASLFIGFELSVILSVIFVVGLTLASLVTSSLILLNGLDFELILFNNFVSISLFILLVIFDKVFWQERQAKTSQQIIGGFYCYKENLRNDLRK